MFCLMDVSGSMGEREKDLAKRFFILLHLFLKRRYEQTDIVFIRHTHEAQEVDEETFFYSRETGGTVVSTALDGDDQGACATATRSTSWNIYAAQASDGDNFPDDGDKCIRMLNEDILPLCQYFAYVEIVDERETDMFQSTGTTAPSSGRHTTRCARHGRNFADEAHRPAERHLSGVPRAVREAGRRKRRCRR